MGVAFPWSVTEKTLSFTPSPRVLSSAFLYYHRSATSTGLILPTTLIPTIYLRAAQESAFPISRHFKHIRVKRQRANTLAHCQPKAKHPNHFSPWRKITWSPNHPQRQDHGGLLNASATRARWMTSRRVSLSCAVLRLWTGSVIRSCRDSARSPFPLPLPLALFLSRHHLNGRIRPHWRLPRDWR